MSLDLKSLQKKLESAVEAGLKKVGVMTSGSSYFGGARKGESAELQADLNSTSRLKQVNALKRIIANMSLGRDVSQLFADVVKLGQSTNLEIKKLVYLYVLSNARLQPEKALLAVNTFLLDCHSNASPIIRALAIRTMLCLRTETVLEYLVEPLKKALTVDGDPYVRKTAAIGVIKLFHQNPRTMEDHGLLPTLAAMVADTNPVVASNAAAAVLEIVAHRHPRDAAAHPLALPAKWADKLLHTLSECSEWGQVYVLDLLGSHHEPAEDQLEMTIERILPRLSHLNAAVVLAAVKCVLRFSRHVADEAARKSYIAKVNSALVTLSRTDPDTQFIVIKNIQALLPIYPSLLRDKIDGFFVRFNDPLCVKREKLRLLMMLLHEENADKIAKELAEYATDVDPAFLSRVVHAIAVASIKQPSIATRCVALLHLVAEKQKDMLPHIFVAAKNLLRRHPDKAQELMKPLLAASSAPPGGSAHGGGSAAAAGASTETNPQLVLSTVEGDRDATVALVWILGEFCDALPNGVATLDQFTGNFVALEPAVQNAVMTAMVKLFLRNPAQVERLLTPLFETATKSSLDPDVRDRAFMYYRLLAKGSALGVEKMKAVLHSAKTASIDTDEARTRQRLSVDEVLESLNSAAAVLEMPAKSFLLPYGLHSAAVHGQDDGEDDEDRVYGADAAAEGGDNNNKAAANSNNNNTKPANPAGTSLDDIFQGGGTPAPAPVRHASGGGGGGGLDIFGGSAAPPVVAAQPLPPKRELDPFAQVASIVAAAAPKPAPPPPVQQQQPKSNAFDSMFDNPAPPARPVTNNNAASFDPFASVGATVPAAAPPAPPAPATKKIVTADDLFG